MREGADVVALLDAQEVVSNRSRERERERDVDRRTRSNRIRRGSAHGIGCWHIECLQLAPSLGSEVHPDRKVSRVDGVLAVKGDRSDSVLGRSDQARRIHSRVGDLEIHIRWRHRRWHGRRRRRRWLAVRLDLHMRDALELVVLEETQRVRASRQRNRHLEVRADDVRGALGVRSRLARLALEDERRDVCREHLEVAAELDLSRSVFDNDRFEHAVNLDSRRRCRWRRWVRRRWRWRTWWRRWRRRWRRRCIWRWRRNTRRRRTASKGNNGTKVSAARRRARRRHPAPSRWALGWCALLCGVLCVLCLV